MDSANILSPTVDMECGVKGLLPTDVETPSSLLGSSETSCVLKQSRLLFPPSSTTVHPPPPTRSRDTPTTTPTQEQLECVPCSNGSPPQHSSNAPPTTTTPMEVEVSDDTSDGPGRSAPPTAVSATLTKVKKTKKEIEALRLERERLKAEAQAIREQERLKKEEARLMREREKKARRERREQEERAKQERKEAKEREKREKQERKEEEERKRKEEKRRAELEKQTSAEEKIRKQNKEQALFSSFFSKLPKTGAQTNGKSENERRGVVFDASVFDGMINSQTAPSYSNLTHHCQSHRPHNYKPRPTVGSDDVIITSSPNAPPDNDVIIMSSPNVLPRPRMKLLQFHSNVRPPYFGSWRKKSKVISGRAPFKIDKSVLDYEFDSDDEWEEEEPGESVSSASEGEESGGEDSGEEGEEDGFFVPHGYLSEDEGERSDTEEGGGGGGGPGTQMDKVKAKARAWEAEFQRTCQPKKPVCIGCVWVSDGGGEGGEGRRREEEAFLSQFSALVLTETPVRVKPIASVTTSPPETHTTSVTDNQKRPVPEEAMPDLIRLVHQSTAGLGKLIKTFQTHWGTVLQNRAATAVGEVGQGGARATRDHRSPPASSGGGGLSPQVREGGGGEGENQSGISKRQLEKKIQQIAVKEVRSPSTKQAWYVHEAVLQKYNIDPAHLVPLFPPTPKSCGNNPAEKSCSPEAPLSTPISKKGNKRRAAGNTPTLFEVFARSPQTTGSATAPAQKRLKLVPSPVGSVVKPTGGSKPPKKRIKLESLSLKSTPPPPAGTGEKLVIVIDDSSTDTQPSTNSTITVQPTDNSKPLTNIIVTDNTKPSTNSTVVVQPTGNSKPSTNSTVVVQPTSNSKPSTISTTPSRKAQVSLLVKRIPQAPTAHQTTDDKTVVPSTKEGTKCLQEVTNSQKSMLGPANSEDGATNRENRQRIDWQKLLSDNSSTSNQVMVIADIH